MVFGRSPKSLKQGKIRQRIWDVIYSMGADQNVVKEWNITQEQAAKQ